MLTGATSSDPVIWTGKLEEPSGAAHIPVGVSHSTRVPKNDAQAPMHNKGSRQNDASSPRTAATLHAKGQQSGLDARSEVANVADSKGMGRKRTRNEKHGGKPMQVPEQAMRIKHEEVAVSMGPEAGEGGEKKKKKKIRIKVE